MDGLRDFLIGAGVTTLVLWVGGIIAVVVVTVRNKLKP